MVAGPAAALELGQVQIESALGQPLRASIAYALNPHEQLYDFCVYLRPGLAANGLPVVSNAAISIADGVILLSGTRAIREPLLTMQVAIDCPYTAHLSREYTLMINPTRPEAVPAVSAVRPAAQSVAAAASSAGAQPPKSRPRAEAHPTMTRTPVAQGSRYLVRRGDSLSEIASRIADRSMALWPAVDRIFAANPDAFVANDPNQLKAGSWLVIPNLSAAPGSAMAAENTASNGVPAAEPGEAVVYSGYQTAADVDSTGSEKVTAPAEAQTVAPAAVEAASAVPPIPESAATVSEYANLQPGDVIVGNDSPFVSPIGPAVGVDTRRDAGVPDTALYDPVDVPPVPIVETGPDRAGGAQTSGSWSRFLWLGGTGLALILGLLLFGQTIRRRFGSVAVGALDEPLPNRRKSDSDSPMARALTDVDFQVPDTAAHSSPIALDADFDDGTGLRDNAEIHVAQDFGFSASSTFEDELDMVLPDSSGEQESQSPTDIIPPPEVEEKRSIVDSEVLPSDDDDGDYDLSMIVDVTKQNVVESDATTKDLQAVKIESADESESDDYTLSQEVDYKILEQDYEEEFTATQALNAELAKAAAELAERMDTDASGQLTTRLPKNTKAENDPVTKADDTGVNEAITAEYPAADNDVTVEMPPDEADVTAEMDVDSAKLGKKKRAS